jgi:pimeloyl-ACP methyl ester carboxylesterase
MPTVTVEERPVRYREEGPAADGGVPVILLHMAGGSSSVWGPVASQVGRSRRVVAPDFPGHGQSAAWASPPEHAGRPAGVSTRVWSLAHWTVALLDALEIPRAVLVGHSMGGCVALCTARLAPGRVAGLGLVCSSARLHLPPGFRDVLQHHYATFVQSFTQAALPSHHDTATAHRARPIFPQAEQDVVVADFLGVDGFDVVDGLPSIRVPAAVVAGEMDAVTPPLHAHQLAQGLPDATLTLVPGAAHLLPREAPAQVTHALLGLLARVR